MPIEILMPALSPTMTEGKIARWLKSEGEPVRAGDVLAEIETDKATMEVEAIDEGVLARIVIPEGTEHVAVNTPIAVIAANGETIKAEISRTLATGITGCIAQYLYQSFQTPLMNLAQDIAEKFNKLGRGF